MARKYQEVKGWWVYSIKIPSINKYYIGISKQQCCKRWHKSHYKDTSLAPYLNEWDSMIKTVLVDNLTTKKESLIYEDNIIRALSMNDLCINEQRSGLIKVSDKNAYARELLKNNTELRERNKQRNKQRYQNDAEYREQQKEYMKQYYNDNKEKLREYSKQYYERKKLEKQQINN